MNQGKKYYKAEEAKPKRFITLSMIIHGILAFGLLYLTLPLAEKFKEDQVVELKYGTESAPEETSDLSTKMSPVTEPVPEESDIAEQSPQQSTQSVKNEVVQDKAVQTKPITMAMAQPQVEEIDAEDVVEESNAIAESTSSKLEVADDGTEAKLKEEKQARQAKIVATEAALAKDMEDAMAEQDQLVEAISQQTDKDAEALAQNLKEVQQKNSKALADARANEEKESAAKAALTAEAVKSAGGADQNGEGQKGVSLNGASEGVRTIEELRQQPGNPKPAYDLEERLRHEQGKVVFQAYITKEGVPKDFKLVQSTGFRNLDKKTLVALKKWKFYPGQEGWVEIPFSWDLKGGEEEAPTTLRRYGANN